MKQIIAWLKARDLAEIALGGVIGFLMAGALATTVFHHALDKAQARAIENAQLQISDAIAKANAFRDSIECVAETIVAGCKSYEPRVRQ